MPESNGTVVGGQAVFTALDTFLTANGWAQHDTDPENLGTATGVDTVYISNGVSGNQFMYLRATLPAKLLDYDAQSANFTIGLQVTGGTSGATGTIVFDNDAGATGTLHLVDVVGQFEDNEALTDSGSGAATVDGLLQYQDPPDPSSLDHWYDNIIFRGYNFWNASTHVGTGQIRGWDTEGGIAPSILSPEGGNNSLVKRDFTLFVPDATADRKSWMLQNGSIYNMAGEYNPASGLGGEYQHRSFDGRQWWRVSSSGAINDNNLRNMDLPTWREKLCTSTNSVNLNGSATPLVLVPDKATGKMYIYAMHDTLNAATAWKRWDPDTGIWSQRATHPFGNVNMDFSTGVWDGIDRIYWDRGDGQTGANTFFYYEISTDTWSAALANVPAGRNSGTHRRNNTPVYIHAGRQPGLVSGLTEDVIYWPLDGITTSVRRYNVTSDSWTTLSLPDTDNNGSSDVNYVPADSQLTWDGRRYLYFFPLNDDRRMFRWDLQVDGGAGTPAANWVDLGNNHPNTGKNALIGALTMTHAIGQVPTLPGVTQEYFISGDADAVKIVMKLDAAVNDFRYFWSYFGVVDNSGYQKTDVMNATVAIVPGTPSTVTVDDTSAFAPGDEVLIFDPTDGATERISIISTPTATTFTANIFGSFSDQSIIAVDPNPFCIASDLGQSVVNLDRDGFESDGMGNVYWLRRGSEVLWPTMNADRSDLRGRARPITSPTVRNRTQVFPLILHWPIQQNPPGNRDGDLSEIPDPALANQTMFHSEVRGQLAGVFDINASNGSRAPVAEQVINLAGRQYRIFPPGRLQGHRGTVNPDALANDKPMSIANLPREINEQWTCIGPID